MDRGLPGSSVHGILQARTLEWVAISLSKSDLRQADSWKIDTKRDSVTGTEVGGSLRRCLPLAADGTGLGLWRDLRARELCGEFVKRAIDINRPEFPVWWGQQMTQGNWEGQGSWGDSAITWWSGEGVMVVWACCHGQMVEGTRRASILDLKKHFGTWTQL